MRKTIALAALCAAFSVSAQTLTIDASKVVCRVEPLIYGSGAEDVNHEIYGGLYDQKIFGEGFEEPAMSTIRGFTSYDEAWRAVDGMAQLQTSHHGKLIYEGKQMARGVVEVEVRMDDINAIAGLIVNVTEPRGGADSFNGYEVALNARSGTFVLGKHQYNWQSISTVPASFNPLGEWNKLRVQIDQSQLDIYLNDKLIESFKDDKKPLASGRVGLRSYGGSATFRHLKIDGVAVPMESNEQSVSAMWAPVGQGVFLVDTHQPFTGLHSQKMMGKAGTGIYNKGLNRWGISIEKNKPLRLSLYLRGTVSKVQAALQSASGSKEFARTEICGVGEAWQRFDVVLTPKGSDPAGRFVLELGEEGSVNVDQVLLCTDSYPFRADLTEAFKQEGLTFLRYGGTMVNARAYMSKDMVGSRLERQPYWGHWYRYATNGFAIPEFMQFARLINTEPTFAINIEDQPEDVLALLQYIKPYGLKFIEIGNEECIGTTAREAYEHYVVRYLILYEAIHKEWPDLQFINAAWWRPDHLETMQYVFEQLDGKCDYWDYHPWTETPQQARDIEKEVARMKALFLQWNPKTTMRCAILEENGNNHNMSRALAHAVMLNVVRRSAGFVPLDSPANALQPEKQNDNGWDQGQIFFSPSQVWMQPPYYAQQMAAKNHQPLLVESCCTDGRGLDCTATRNVAGDTLVLHIVNYETTPRTLLLDLKHFGEVTTMQSLTLSGDEKATNTPQRPTRIAPKRKRLKPSSKLSLKPYSYSVVVLTRA